VVQSRKRAKPPAQENRLTPFRSVHAVVALQSRNGAIVGLETPDGDPDFLETAIVEQDLSLAQELHCE